MATAARPSDAESPLRRFLNERFESGATDNNEKEEEEGRYHADDAEEQQPESDDENDDDSSAAMDRFLRARMDVVLQKQQQQAQTTTASAMTSASNDDDSSDSDDNSNSGHRDGNSPNNPRWFDESVAKKWIQGATSANGGVTGSALSSTFVEGEGDGGVQKNVDGDPRGHEDSDIGKDIGEKKETGFPTPPREASDSTTAASSSPETNSGGGGDSGGDVRAIIAPPANAPAAPSDSHHQNHDNPSTPTRIQMYNPFSNYSSSSGSAARRKEIMGMSIPILSSFVKSSPAPLIPRVEVEAGPTPVGVEPSSITPGANSEYDFDNDDDDNSIDSDRALERWSKQIRMELRQAEMLELAVEAERAAESGIKSFAAKLSTYGGDDSLLVSSASKRRTRSPLFKRRRSFTEGAKPEQIRRRVKSASARIRVVELRDVNEVFPPFRQFHSHLRTHFARSHVDERILNFKESKKSSKQRWGGNGDLASPQSSSHSRSPSDFFKHKRLPSDFFKHTRSPSDLFKHHKTPSDFFQSLTFDSWANRGIGASTDTADDGVAVDVLADHLHTPTDKVRRLPKLKVPEGLELPDLSFSLRRKGRSKKTSEPEALAACSSDPGYSQHQISPKSLFDRDDGLESDDERNHSPHLLADGPGGHVSQPHAESPVVRDGGGAQTKSGPDFVTPARLRVIRDGTYQNLLESELPTVENLLLTPPNSVLERGKSEPVRTSLKHHELSPESEDPAVSILLPERLGRPSSGALDIPKINLSFKHGSSDAPDDDLLLGDLDALPLYESDRASATSVSGGRLFSDHQPGDHGGSQFPNEGAPQTPPKNDNDDSGIQASPPSREHPKRRIRRRSVKVMIYGSGLQPSERATSGDLSGGILQHSQTIALADSYDARDKTSSGAMNSAADCACLALEDPCSPQSMCSSIPTVLDVAKGSNSKSNVLKKSASAEALSSLDTGRAKWNLFSTVSMKHEESSCSRKSAKQPFQAAMEIFSRMSPKKKPKSSFLRPRENDEFLRNYLYCSKPPEGVYGSQEVCAEPACADVNTDVCCTSLLPDAYFGPILPSSFHRRQAQGGTLLSLSGPMEAESWLDLANERFDGVLGQLAGRTNNEGTASPWNVSFQAPILKKTGEDGDQLSAQAMRERIYSIVDESGTDLTSTDGAVPATPEHFVDEKKSEIDDGNDTISSQASSQGSKHVRHLSYFPSSNQGSPSAISDSQFQFLYGMPREALADSLIRNIEPTENDVTESLSGATTFSQDCSESAGKGPPGNEIIGCHEDTSTPVTKALDAPSERARGIEWGGVSSMEEALANGGMPTSLDPSERGRVLSAYNGAGFDADVVL